MSLVNACKRRTAALTAGLLLTPVGFNGARAGWIDAATGQPVQTVPYSGLVPGSVNQRIMPDGPWGDPSAIGSDPNHASFPSNSRSPLAGHTLYWDKVCGTWRDSGTGDEVKTVPYSGLVPGVANQRIMPDGPWGDPSTIGSDPNHASFPSNSTSPLAGHTLFWQPCPPPQQSSAAWTGPFAGIQLAGVGSGVTAAENINGLATSSHVQYTNFGTTIGGGLNTGFNWQLPNTSVVVGGVVVLNGLNDTVTHGFTGGSSIGSTVDFTGYFQARAGILATPDLLIFGQTGVAISHMTTTLNFSGKGTSAQGQVIPGFTFGAGVEWRPPGLVVPLVSGDGWISVFADYSHTWWGTAAQNGPSVAPYASYTWQRQSDTVSIGARLHF